MGKKGIQKHKTSVRDPLLGHFASARLRPGPAIYTLKAHRTYAQAKSIIATLMQLRLHKPIFETRSTQEWDRVMSPPLLPRSPDWLQEFGWLAHGFLQEADYLNSFLLLRREFGKAYLLGRFKQASEILTAIEKDHGLGLWLAERRFMVLQADSGFAAHKEELSRIQTQITNSFVGYVVTTISNRIEPHVDPDSFLRSTQRVLQNLRTDGHVEFASLMELHIAPWSFDWTADRHTLLHSCGRKVLVDRYDRVLKAVACVQPSTLNDEESALFCEILMDLRARIEDRQLDHLLLTLGVLRREVDRKTEHYFSALDLFVTGRHNDCASEIANLLSEDPTCFDFYWLLARAMACSDTTQALEFTDSCLAHNIITHLHEIAEGRTSIVVSLVALNTIALKLGDNHLGLSLWQFVQYEHLHARNEEAALQVGIQSKIDAFDIVLNDYASQSLLSSDLLIDIDSEHPSIALAQYEAAHSKYGGRVDPRIAPSFAAVARARRYATEDKHNNVLEELQTLLNYERIHTKEEIFHEGAVALLEFEALTGLDRAEDAAAAILRHYIRNKNILRHVPFERLIAGGLSGRWPTLRRFACWPILVYLDNGSEQDIYEAVDDFLLEHDCKSPLSIADGKIVCTDAELRILLRDVLVPAVIARGALWQRTAEDRRRLRTQLLQKLFAISLEDQAFVVDELSQLEQARLLENAYRNIEGPKFHLDYTISNRNIATVFEGTFARFAEYRAYENQGGTLATEGELLTLAKIGASVKPNTDKKQETSDVLLRYMATGAFIAYLFDNNSGINSSLGTRIRHGSLENQLTRVFGAHSLLAIRDVGGNYKCEQPILDLLKPFPEDKRSEIEQAYSQFTEAIARLLEDLISSRLRIRVPEPIFILMEEQGFQTGELRSNEGLLDFTNLFSTDTLHRLKGMQFTSIGGLLSEAERTFVSAANDAFAGVRRFFEREIAESVNAALGLLDNNIKEHLPDSTTRVVLRAGILEAKSEFAQDLKIIQNWFAAAGRVEVGVGSMREVIEMAYKVVDFASNGKLGRLSPGGFEDERLKPEVGMLMYETLSILLRNVVQHSKMDGAQVVEYENTVEGERRRLVVRNKVMTRERCEDLVARAMEAIALPFNDGALGSSPGGTGFTRIRKLLKQAGYTAVDLSVCRSPDLEHFELTISYTV